MDFEDVVDINTSLTAERPWSALTRVPWCYLLLCCLLNRRKSRHRGPGPPDWEHQLCRFLDAFPSSVADRNETTVDGLWPLPRRSIPRQRRNSSRCKGSSCLASLRSRPPPCLHPESVSLVSTAHAVAVCGGGGGGTEEAGTWQDWPATGASSTLRTCYGLLSEVA